MIGLTPTERLQWLRDQPWLAEAHENVDQLLDQYEQFLATTNHPESEIVNSFMDKQVSGRYMTAAYKFGDLVFEVLARIGHGNLFYRLLVV